MSVRSIASVALLLLAGCSSGFEPGEDLAAVRGGTGEIVAPDTGPSSRECTNPPTPRSSTAARCLR